VLTTRSVTAKETLQEYFDKLGGRPRKKPEPAKKRKRKTEELDTPKSNGRGKKSKTDTPEPATISTKKGAGRKTQTEWKPPNGTWENDIANIDTIEEIQDPKTGKPIRFAYVVWVDGHKSRHELSTMNRQAPQKVKPSSLRLN
jgi:chromobox protein 1